jgi:hypothetical protein
MKIYFEKFGETVLIQLKKKPDGSSRGFGFIKFKKLEEQVRGLCSPETPHVLTWRRWERKFNLRGAHFSFVQPLVSPFQLKTKN